MQETGPARCVPLRETPWTARPLPTSKPCGELLFQEPPASPAPATLHLRNCTCSTALAQSARTHGSAAVAQAHWRTGLCRERCRLPVAMAAPAPGLISVFSSPQELGASLAQLVAQRAASCLEGDRGRFALGLSGGSLVSMLARDLPAAAAPAGPASFARWTLGFCDERLVPFDHAESTYGLYRVSAAGARTARATGAAVGHAELAQLTVETQATGAAVGHAESAQSAEEARATPNWLSLPRKRQDLLQRLPAGSGPHGVLLDAQ